MKNKNSKYPLSISSLSLGMEFPLPLWEGTKGRGAKFFITCVAFSILCVSLSLAQDEKGISAEQGPLIDRDLMQRMINLVLESNPELLEQREFLRQIKELPEPAEGYLTEEEIKGLTLQKTAGVTMDSMERIRGMWIGRREKIVSMEISYIVAEKGVIANVIDSYVSIKNSKENLKEAEELREILQREYETAKKEVQMGIRSMFKEAEKSLGIFDYERMILQNENAIRQQRRAFERDKLKTAISLVGDKYPELLELLNRIQ